MSRYDDLLAEAIIMGTVVPFQYEARPPANGWIAIQHGFKLEDYVDGDNADAMFGIIVATKMVAPDDRLVIYQYITHHFKIAWDFSKVRRNFMHRITDLGYVQSHKWDMDRTWFTIPGTEITLSLFDISEREYSSFKLTHQKAAYLNLLKELFDIFTQRPG